MEFECLTCMSAGLRYEYMYLFNVNLFECATLRRGRLSMHWTFRCRTSPNQDAARVVLQMWQCLGNTAQAAKGCGHKRKAALPCFSHTTEYSPYLRLCRPPLGRYGCCDNNARYLRLCRVCSCLLWACNGYGVAIPRMQETVVRKIASWTGFSWTVRL